MQLIGLPLNLLLLTIISFGASRQIAGYLETAVSGAVGKNGSTVAVRWRADGAWTTFNILQGTSVIYPALPLTLFTALHLMVYFKSDSGVFSDNIVLFCLCFGAVSSKLCNRLIVRCFFVAFLHSSPLLQIAYMSRSPLDWWDSIYISPLLLALNQYCNNAVPELWMLYFCLVCFI